MKGVLLAAAISVLMVALSALGLRLYRGKREYKVLLGVFGFAVLLYLVMFATLPANLTILPNSWLEPAASVDFWNGLLILAMIFHGFWVFSYVACVGPSVGLMTAIWRQGQEGLTTERALAMYGAMDSVNTILLRRLPKLIEGGYLTEQGGTYQLTRKGRRYAVVGRILRRTINLAPETKFA